MPKTTTSAVLSDEDVRRKYYETAGHQMWITEMQLDPLQLIVCDDASGKYFRVGVAVGNGEIKFSDPAGGAGQYADLSARLSAIPYEDRKESLSGIDVTPETFAVGGPIATPDA